MHLDWFFLTCPNASFNSNSIRFKTYSYSTFHNNGIVFLWKIHAVLSYDRRWNSRLSLCRTVFVLKAHLRVDTDQADADKVWGHLTLAGYRSLDTPSWRSTCTWRPSSTSVVRPHEKSYSVPAGGSILYSLLKTRDWMINKAALA